MKVALLDSTIREGEQSPNVSFSVEQKIEIVKALDDFGVEFIELGHPAVSPDIREAIANISEIKTRAKKVIHCRAMRSDIDLAISLNIPWIGIFFGTSDLSLKHKFGIDRQSALVRIADAITYAKDFGINIRFTAEDACRTDISFLIEVARLAETSGADRFSIADTVGALTPDKTNDLIKTMKNEISIPIHFHGHNDLGMATANTIAAATAGAEVVDVSINGIGERCGIASLAEVAVILKTQFNIDNDWDLSALIPISRMIEGWSGISNRLNQPIIGANAFTHKSGLHTRAVLKDPRSYEVIPPEIVNQERKIIIDKFTGKEVVADRLAELNIPPTERMVDSITRQIKSRPKAEPITDMELLNLI